MSYLYDRSLAIGSAVLGLGVRARSARTQTLVGGLFAVNVLRTRGPRRPTGPASVDRPRSIRTLGHFLPPVVFHDVAVGRRLTLVHVLVPSAVRIHRVRARFFTPVSAAILRRDFQHSVPGPDVYRVLYEHKSVNANAGFSHKIRFFFLCFLSYVP